MLHQPPLPSYILSSGEILGEEENKFKKILDDKNKNAKSAGECIVKVLKNIIKGKNV